MIVLIEPFSFSSEFTSFSFIKLLSKIYNNLLPFICFLKLDICLSNLVDAGLCPFVYDVFSSVDREIMELSRLFDVSRPAGMFEIWDITAID